MHKSDYVERKSYTEITFSGRQEINCKVCGKLLSVHWRGLPCLDKRQLERAE